MRGKRSVDMRIYILMNKSASSTVCAKEEKILQMCEDGTKWKRIVRSPSILILWKYLCSSSQGSATSAPSHYFSLQTSAVILMSQAWKACKCMYFCISTFSNVYWALEAKFIKMTNKSYRCNSCSQFFVLPPKFNSIQAQNNMSFWLFFFLHILTSE